MSVGININESSLFISNFDSLGQPEWVHIIRSIYHLFATIVCLGGNSLVLMASFKYNAVDLDEVSLGLLQNLAVADILVGLLREIPTLVSGIARRWLFGREMCWLIGIVYWLPQKVEFLTVTVISLHRTYKLLSPLSVRGLKTIQSTRKLCCCLWFVVACALTLDILAGLPVTFDTYGSNCVTYGWSDSSNPTLALQLAWFLGLLFFAAIPIFLITVSNLTMLFVAALYRWKHTGRAIPSKNAFITVSLVAWSFLISLLPAILVIAIPTLTGTPLPAWPNMFAWECLTINIWINPLIYTFINVKFRNFVVKTVQDTFTKLQNLTSTSTRVHPSGANRH